MGSVDPFVLYSRADPNPAREVFVVGPHMVPALADYARVRRTISNTVVRVILIPPA